MPIGASRLPFLALSPAVAVDPRTSTRKSVTLVDNAVISTAQNKFGGSSVLIDGTADGIHVDSTNLQIGGGDFTIEFWFYPTSLGANDYVLDCGSGFSGKINWFFDTATTYKFRQGSTTILSGNHGLSTNQWQHIAISRASGTIKYFLNGSEQHSASNSTTFSSSWFRIGTYQTGGPYGIQGYLDEYRVSNSARYSSGFTAPSSAFTADSNTDLLLHFDGSNGDTTTTDDGPRALSEWANGGFTQTSGVFNNGLQLTAGGSHAYLNILPAGAEFDDDQTLTLEFRFKISNGGTSNRTTKLFSTQGINNDNYPTSSNHVTLHTYADGNLYLSHDGGETNMGNPGTGFHHIAMQYNGSGSFRVWLDGTHKAERSHSISATTNLFFGNRKAGEGTNSGTNTIDEIRVSSNNRYTHSSSSITVPTSEFTSDDNTIALFHCESTSQTDDNS